MSNLGYSYIRLVLYNLFRLSTTQPCWFGFPIVSCSSTCGVWGYSRTSSVYYHGNQLRLFYISKYICTTSCTPTLSVVNKQHYCYLSDTSLETIVTWTRYRCIQCIHDWFTKSFTHGWYNTLLSHLLI